jgi:hypothetical protein
VTDLAPIAGKLANIIRRLASDKDGEVVAAARVMIRTLQGIGADIHDVAARIEHSGNGALSEHEMQEIYDAGVKAGIRQQRQRASGPANGTVHLPPARDMAIHCYQRIDELKSDWEREFVINMASWTRLRPLSVKQQASTSRENLSQARREDLNGRI